jgi:hypothetical protein
MGMFPAFETMFWTVFISSLIFMVLFFVVLIIRIMKAGSRFQEKTASETQPIIKEKEIIREIVKIRCPYCGNLYDEKLDKCPYCGGKKRNSKFQTNFSRTKSCQNLKLRISIITRQP